MSTLKLTSAGPVDAKLIEDLVAASRILAHHGVLDAWGHVSMRHPSNPQRYLMSRARAPALVSIEDIMEFDLDSIRSTRATAAASRALHPRQRLQGAARRQRRGAQPFADRRAVLGDRAAAARGPRASRRSWPAAARCSTSTRSAGPRAS